MPVITIFKSLTENCLAVPELWPGPCLLQVNGEIFMRYDRDWKEGGLRNVPVNRNGKSNESRALVQWIETKSEDSFYASIITKTHGAVRESLQGRWSVERDKTRVRNKRPLVKPQGQTRGSIRESLCPGSQGFLTQHLLSSFIVHCFSSFEEIFIDFLASREAPSSYLHQIFA